MKLQPYFSITSDSQMADLNAGAVAITQAIATLVTAGKVLRSLSFTVLSGTAQMVDSDGTTITNIPTGFSQSYSPDQNAKLTPPTSITANVNSRVIIGYSLS